MFLENVAPFKTKKKEVVDNILQIDLEKKYVRTPETRLKRSWPCLFFLIEMKMRQYLNALK